MNEDKYVDSNPQWRGVQQALLETQRLTAERGIELVVMIIPAMAKFDDATYPLKDRGLDGMVAAGAKP